MKRKSVIIPISVLVCIFGMMAFCPGRIIVGRRHIDKSWLTLGRNGEQRSDWPKLFNQKKPDYPTGVGVSVKIYGIRVGNILLRVRYVTENLP